MDVETIDRLDTILVDNLDRFLLEPENEEIYLRNFEILGMIAKAIIEHREKTYVG